MLHYKWTHAEIQTQTDVMKFMEFYRSVKPKVGAFDTESNGLHIIKCRPFLFQFGFITTNNLGYTWLVDLTMQGAKQIMQQLVLSLQSLDILLAHNTKFDLHMLENYGTPYKGTNLSDTQFYIRHAFDHIPIQRGGPSLKLKDFSAKYITPDAKAHEKLLKLEQKNLAKVYNAKLTKAMSDTRIDPPKELGAKTWTLGALKNFFKDITNSPSDFHHIELVRTYLAWWNSLPYDLRVNVVGIVKSKDIPYTMLNIDVVKQYAHLDIVYTLEIYALTQPTIEARGTQNAIDFENKAMIPFYNMERVGFKLDRQYILESEIRMKNHILLLQDKFKQIAQADITVNQSNEIIKVFARLGVNIASTGNEVLQAQAYVLKQKEGTEEALELIALISSLRTLKKWMTTYLQRLRLAFRYGTDRIYTQIHSVGTVSGRVSSDFQQFPKGGIVDEDGNELFNPRRAVIVDDIYNKIIYLDYSQIELRIQALYTILLGEGDLNLCRAYMPYKCFNKDNIYFDYENQEHLKNYIELGPWYHAEDKVEWHPVDVHGATTKAAFEITEDHPDFKKLRGLGKRVNFAKNYGAQQNRIAIMFPNEDAETVERIDQGYYKAFPGIKIYQDYCYDLGLYQPYATNLYGYRYWNVNGHNLINMLIQGSSAYLLKEKIIDVHNMLATGRFKSRMQMNIHDEISFEVHPDDNLPLLIHELLDILQKMEGTKIPIIADVEETVTNWADKYDVK